MREKILFVTKKALSQAIGLSPETFKKYRLKGDWIEGIHWQRINTRCILYNLQLIQDWIANRQDPKVHEQAIAAYLNSLPSSQSFKKSRNKSSYRKGFEEA
jgi:Putative excisionase (DUF1233)